MDSYYMLLHQSSFFRMIDLYYNVSYVNNLVFLLCFYLCWGVLVCASTVKNKFTPTVLRLTNKRLNFSPCR